MKYSLIFKEILKRVAIEEKDIVTETIQKLEQLTEILNNSQHTIERNRLRQEREKFYGLNVGTLAGPARYFISDGNIKIITHNTKVVQSLILCNDIIMIGKKPSMFSGPRFRTFPLCEIQVIRHEMGTSSRFILRLAQNEGTFFYYYLFLLSLCFFDYYVISVAN